MARLTDLSIRNLRPGKARYEVSDGGTALRVVVHETGRKSFAVRYRHNGVQRKLTLNGGISLAAARKLAADALYEVERGIDPAAAKQAAKATAKIAKADTVQAICEEYLRREGDKLRTVKTRVCAFQQLIYPRIGALPIGSVTRSQVARLIDAIEDKHGSRRADLALAYLRRVFNWHALRADDFWSPVVKGMGRYSTREHARDRTLTDDEIRAVWRATEAKTPFDALVRFSLLTAGRPGEIAGLSWAEIVDGVWHLPAARNKTGINLARPLSAAALAIIEAQPRIGDSLLVFSNDGKHQIDSWKPKDAVAKASGTSGWTMHDLRRTARTLLSRAGVSVDVAERCLGHVIGGVRGTYDRHQYQEEMARAYAALAGQLDLIVRPPTGNVRQLRRRG